MCHNPPIDRRPYWIAFLFCAAACALPFILTPRLPLIDLPQHAAQIAIWKHFDDACQRFARTFEFNWFTPYLFGYLLVRALSAVVAIDVAFRIALYLAVVALPLALHYLATRTGAEPWLSLLGFPLAFGFTFYWGFINYQIAIPLAVLYVASVYDLAAAPATRRAIGLLALAVLLVVSHALIFLFCAAITAGIALFVRPLKNMLPVVLPAVLPMPFVLWWVSRMRSSEPLVSHTVGWNLGLFRCIHFPSMLLSDEYDTAAVAAFAIAILALLAMRMRVSRDPRRWIVLAVAGAIYFAGPQAAFGTAFVFQRFAIFTAIGALLVLEPARRAAWARGLLAGIAIGWAVLLAVRFDRFARESADFDRIVEEIPAGRSLAFYIARPRSEFVPGSVYVHYPAYYQEQKGGTISWSFASFFPQLIRYRAGAAPPLNGSVIGDPAQIDWRGLSTFDFVLIRSTANPTAALARYAPYPLFPRMRARTWWLYATPRGRNADPSCPPLDQRTRRR